MQKYAGLRIKYTFTFTPHFADGKVGFERSNWRLLRTASSSMSVRLCQRSDKQQQLPQKTWTWPQDPGPGWVTVSPRFVTQAVIIWNLTLRLYLT